MTKRQYRTTRERVERDLERVKRLIACADRLLDNVTSDTKPSCVVRAYGNRYNAYTDELWEIERAMRDLDSRYECRNWTRADHNFYALVCANVD